VEGPLAVVRLHPSAGFKAGAVVTVKQKNAALRLPVVVDERVPPHAAWIAGGIAETATLSELFGEVEIAN
jgi:hypothetical protein